MKREKNLEKTNPSLVEVLMGLICFWPNGKYSGGLIQLSTPGRERFGAAGKC